MTGSVSVPVPERTWKGRRKKLAGVLVSIFISSALALCIALLPGPAGANVITFDDLPQDQIPNGYSGLNWSGFYVLHSPYFGETGTGIDSGIVSLPSIAVQQFAGHPVDILAPSDTFDLNSAYFAGVFYDNLLIDVRGYKPGTPLGYIPDYSTTFVVNVSAPTLYVFNWGELVSVRINACCGSKHGSFNYNEANYFVMDDLRINESFGVNDVPEPSTIALFGMALLSLFGFGMMRRHGAKP